MSRKDADRTTSPPPRTAGTLRLATPPRPTPMQPKHPPQQQRAKQPKLKPPPPPPKQKRVLSSELLACKAANIERDRQAHQEAMSPRRAANLALLARLQAIHPRTFDAYRPLPLAVGSFDGRRGSVGRSCSPASGWLRRILFERRGGP